MKTFFISFILLLNLNNLFATELAENRLNELKSIKKMKTMNDNQVFRILRVSSEEISEDWNSEIAKEMARVYALVLKKNKNYFIAELFKKARESQGEKFEKVLKKELSKEDFEHYKHSIQMRKKEISEGNG